MGRIGSGMTNSARALVETIEALPPARQAEVTQFVAFVAAREREASVTRNAAAVSAPSFAAAWDNDDDAVYDGL